MPAPARPSNRGPAAAAENRAAILAAARTLFTDAGYRVPLRTIAKHAGVGQGVLYRHFSDRLTLADAVFAENFDAFERLVDTVPGPECFGVLWRRMVVATLESGAFIDMVIDARTRRPGSQPEQRLRELVAEPLARAQAAGLINPTWTVADVELLLHMIHGVANAQPDQSQAPQAVHRALFLIDPRLVEPDQNS